MTDIPRHWDEVYQHKPAHAVSWYQARPDQSLAFIRDSQISPDAPLIDVGGGASTLVDHLLDRHYTDVTVLDISPYGLTQAQTRLGRERARQVQWITQDITQFQPTRRYALWHDRAVLHFLTDAAARAAYVAALERSVAPGGSVIVATFADDGPARCSGLDIARYDAAALRALFGHGYTCLAEARDIHVTPWGSSQAFIYVRLRRIGP